MTNPFTHEEKQILMEAIQLAVNEIGPYGDPDLDVGVLQESYTWSEYLTILSTMENHPWSKLGEYRGTKTTMSESDMDVHFLNHLRWRKLYTKIQKLAIDELREYRIQKCRQKVHDKDCSGYLIFFGGAGKVPVTSLIPDEHLEKLGPGFTEDMLGYVIAMCPTCSHIQVYNGPR